MNKIFVITGLSGSGKDSVINELKTQGFDYTQVITTTTRSMRSNESEGNPYYFVSVEEFKKMVSENKFFEWAMVYNNYYGSTKKAVEEALTPNKPVVFRIDVQGAKAIKKEISETKTIFLTVPSLEELKQRLETRGQDSAEVIARRLLEAKEELKTLDQWDYVVANKTGELEQTTEILKKIIKKEFNN